MNTPTVTAKRLQASKLLGIDVIRLGWQGMRSHPLRASLSALGIAIGIAAMIAVIGISFSSQARIQERLASLGTNLLTVSAGKSFGGDTATLPTDAAERLHRIDGVEQVGWLAKLADVSVYRNNLIDRNATNGLTVAATDPELLSATSTQLQQGKWFNDITMRYPTTVLGATAASRLGIVSPGSAVTIDGTPHTVLGILQPSALVPELDTSALVGAPHAASNLGFDSTPTTLFERSADDAVETVRALIPGTVNPQSPNEVAVSRPSDSLAAQHAIDTAFTGLLLGMGSVALLVGGIGVANTMVITVLERRREIGLRRALGATRAHVRRQFLAEAVLLASYGGGLGLVLGVGGTIVVSLLNGWPPTIPPAVAVASVVVTVAVGALAGMLPAMKAARLSPTEALAA